MRNSILFTAILAIEYATAGADATTTPAGTHSTVDRIPDASTTTVVLASTTAATIIPTTTGGGGGQVANEGGPNAGAIAGIVIFVICALIVVVLVLISKKNKKTKTVGDHEMEEAAELRDGNKPIIKADKIRFSTNPPMTNP